MTTTTVDFKNVDLRVNNGTELYVECEMWDGAVFLGDACVIVNIIGKTLIEIRDEAKEMLRAVARTRLEETANIPAIPSSIADFQLSVDYEE